MKPLKLSPLELRILKIFPVQLFLSSNTFSACFNVPVSYCLIYYKFHPCFIRYQWLPLKKLIDCIKVTSPKDKMHTMRHCKFETISDKCSKKGASLWKTSYFPFKSTLNLLQNKGNHCKIKWHTYGMFDVEPTEEKTFDSTENFTLNTYLWFIQHSVAMRWRTSHW